MLLAAFNALYNRDDSMVIVVSPLVALMKDQVQALTAKNVKAIYVGDADDLTIEKVKRGEYNLLLQPRKPSHEC